MNQALLQNNSNNNNNIGLQTPTLGEGFGSLIGAPSGRESSGRGLYLAPKNFNNHNNNIKQKNEKSNMMNKYINESFNQEEEEQKEQRPFRNNKQRYRQQQQQLQKQKPQSRQSKQDVLKHGIQKKSLSDDGSMEEFKFQQDEKSSARGSFEQNFKMDRFAQSKNTEFTQAESSHVSSYMMNTDLWALSITKPNSNRSGSLRNMIYQAMQTALFLLLEWLPFIISLHFIGTSNESAVTGGYGMGIVWSNCFIEFVFGGLGLGLQILVMQAISENRMQSAQNLFKKGLLIVTIFMIPLIGLMFLSGWIIEGISGSSNLGTYTYQYCTYGLPAFYFNGLYNILKGYFRAKKMSYFPLISIGFSAVTSIFWNWLFIFHSDLDSEVIGAALARDVTEFINVFILFTILVVKFSQKEKFTLKIPKQAWKGWTELTKFCLPIGGLLFLEWIGYEIFTFQATHLNDSQFSAHIILNIFNTVFYQVAYGIGIAITSLVNQEMAGYDHTLNPNHNNINNNNNNINLDNLKQSLDASNQLNINSNNINIHNIKNARGESEIININNNKLVNALRYCRIGICMIGVFVFISILPMIFLGSQFSTTFTNDPEAQEAIQEVYGLFLTCLSMDAFLAGTVGITRGIGKQYFASIIFFLSFLILGQLLASIFSYILDGGLVGIWLSILASIFIACFVQVLWTGFSDWEKSLIELQNFRSKEEKERKKMMLHKIKSRDSLLVYQNEVGHDDYDQNDYDDDNYNDNSSNQNKSQETQKRTISKDSNHSLQFHNNNNNNINNNEKYQANQIIIEKEENNNSTINQSNTFQNKTQYQFNLQNQDQSLSDDLNINNKNDSNSSFPNIKNNNAINSSDKSQDPSEQSPYIQPHRRNNNNNTDDESVNSQNNNNNNNQKEKIQLEQLEELEFQLDNQL